MEFRYRAGDERPSLFFPPSSTSSSSSAVPDGFFAAQALRAGYIGVGEELRMSDLLHGPISAREALQRELQKERIREEIIAREIAEKRILEEEVRRELEMERALALRQCRLERILSFGGIPLRSEGRSPLSQLPAEVTFGERLGLGPAKHLTDARVKSLPPVQLNLEKRRAESAPSQEVKLSKANLVGTKRKVGELPPAEKDWSCSLCQVSTTGKKGLDDHLQGRKHKSKEALLRGSTLLPKGADKPPLAMKSAVTNGPKKSKIKAEGKNLAVETGSSEQQKNAVTNGPKKIKIKIKAEGKNLAVETGSSEQQAQQKNAVTNRPKKTKIKAEGNNLAVETGSSEQKLQKTKVVKKINQKLWCDLCQVQCNSTHNLSSHVNGKKHKIKLGESKLDTATATASPAGNTKGNQEQMHKKTGVKKVKPKRTGDRVDGAEESKEQLNNSTEGHEKPAGTDDRGSGGEESEEQDGKATDEAKEEQPTQS